MQPADLVVDVQEGEVISPGTEEIGSGIVSKHYPILGEGGGAGGRGERRQQEMDGWARRGGRNHYEEEGEHLN